MTLLPEVLVELEGLLAKATHGPWYHYDEVFRPQFSQRRVTEIQRAKDGMAIVSWGGFDSLDGPADKKRNANAALIVAAVNNLAALISTARSTEAMRAENERLKGSPWVTEEGFRDTDDLLDMGRVGQSLLERIDDVRRCKGWEHWLPADDPAEIVCDLVNALSDAQTELKAVREALEKAAQEAQRGLHSLDRRRALVDVANAIDKALSTITPTGDEDV